MSLYDRNYMHDTGDSEERSSRSIIWILIAINVAMYLFIAPPGSQMYAKFALCSFPEAFNIWQLLTSGFLHSGLSHILFNMWGLYLFGSLVLPHIGRHKFTLLYLIGVLCGNLIFLTSGWGSHSILIGASGAVCAVMMAAATLEPERKFIMIFMPFAPLKTSTLVVCYTILEILMQFSGAQGGVSHLAHLGGFIGGYIAVKLWFKNTLAWDPLRRKPAPRQQYQQYSFKTTPPPPAAGIDKPVSPGELDALLDKVSREGINSLSEYELARLRRAREDMRGK